MKKILIALLLVFVVKTGWAQYKPADQGSTLKFIIKNLGFGVDGTFSGFDGVINFDPQNLNKSNFDVTINAATVNTDNSLRDDHLKGDSYFDAKNYPQIRLTSTTITGKNGQYIFSGQLTIKKISKPVSFPFSAIQSADGYIFKGSFKMKRKDFNIGGISTIADELEVFLNVTAEKAP